MSLILFRAVRDYKGKELLKTEIALLKELASISNDDGMNAYISQRTLAKKLRCSLSTIHRTKVSLIKKNFLAIAKQGNNLTREANTYLINAPRFLAYTPKFVDNPVHKPVGNMYYRWGGVSTMDTYINYINNIYNNTNPYCNNNKGQEVFNKTKMAKEDKPKPLTLEKDMTKPPINHTWKPIKDLLTPEEVIKRSQEQKVQETAQSITKQQESLYGQNQPLQGQVRVKPDEVAPARIVTGLEKLRQSIAAREAKGHVPRMYGNGTNLKPCPWGEH